MEIRYDQRVQWKKKRNNDTNFKNETTDIICFNKHNTISNKTHFHQY